MLLWQMICPWIQKNYEKEKKIRSFGHELFVLFVGKFEKSKQNLRDFWKFPFFDLKVYSAEKL